MVRWDELTGKELEEKNPKIALLPIGSTERHGDHLPLGTDSIVPEYIAEKVSEKISGSIVLPTIPYGVTISLSRFRGTINVGPEAFHLYVKEVLREVFRNGIELVVIINGHGGNVSTLNEVSKEVAYETGKHIVVVSWWSDVAQEDKANIFRSPGHAGEDETSVVMAIRPDLVKMDYARDHIHPYPSLKIYSRKVDEKLLPFAVNGNPLLASEEKGRKFLDAVIRDIVKAITDVLSYI